MSADHIGSSEDLASFITFFEELGQDSDRAAVIVAAAWCDEALRDLLVCTLRLPPGKTLRSPPGKRDDLLDGDAPLGTFSARINACQRLGVIDDETWRTLHLLRRLRNDCAHSHEMIDLEQPPHIDRVRELIVNVATDEGGIVWVLMRALVTSSGPDRWVEGSPLRGRFGTAKGDFRIVAAWVAHVLKTTAKMWDPKGDPLSLRDSWQLVSQVMRAIARPDLVVEHESGSLWSNLTLKLGTKPEP